MIGEAKKAEVAASRQRADYANPHHDATIPGGGGGDGEQAEADEEAQVSTVHRMHKRARSAMPRAESATMARSAMAHTATVQMASVIEDGPALAMDAAPAAPSAPATPAAPAEAMATPQQWASTTSSKTATSSASRSASGSSAAGNSSPPRPASLAIDFTAIPRQLEASYERFHMDAAIRPTRIVVGDVWQKRAQAALLASAVESSMHASEQTREQHKAFDLLDALSRSGGLTFDAASLHVLVAATHQFASSLTATLVSDNINPIEMLEQSSLIIASTVHDVRASTLLRSDADVERISRLAPAALAADAASTGGSRATSERMAEPTQYTK